MTPIPTRTITPTPILKKDFGEIRGTKYEDRDGDGTLKDSNHQRLVGWTIYLDLNNNGELNSGEPSIITDNHGDYDLLNLSPGPILFVK